MKYCQPVLPAERAWIPTAVPLRIVARRAGEAPGGLSGRVCEPAAQVPAGRSGTRFAVQSLPMSGADAVIGAAVHYARAELVTLGVCAVETANSQRARQGALALRNAAPVFLDRRRVVLIDAGLPTAPYHHEALELDIAAATDLVHRVRRSVTRRASAALSAMQATCGARLLILPASPYDGLPDSLEEVLRSRSLTLAADGMLYRESLAEAAVELGMEVRRYPRRTDPTVLAAETMGVGAAEVTSLLARFGREAGTPWRKDHKMAAAAALSVLGPSRSRPAP